MHSILHSILSEIAALPWWLYIVAVVAAISLVVAITAFFAAYRRRAVIDAVLRASGGTAPLDWYDLSYGDADAKLDAKQLIIPERLWTYDGAYLDRFATVVNGAAVAGGGTALALYIGPTLAWDIVFAIGLSLSVALAEFGIAAVLYWHGYSVIGGAVLFLAGMALVYGAADVGEDLKLVAIFRDWLRAQYEAGAKSAAELAVGTNAERKLHVDAGEAAAANALTRLKLVTISISILGAVIFKILSVIADRVLHAPPTPVAR